jgi:hypothetical protein
MRPGALGAAIVGQPYVALRSVPITERTTDQCLTRARTTLSGINWDYCRLIAMGAAP